MFIVSSTWPMSTSNMSSDNSNLPGAGPRSPDWTLENWPTIAYVHSKMPFESWNLPGAGPFFPDWIWLLVWILVNFTIIIITKSIIIINCIIIIVIISIIDCYLFCCRKLAAAASLAGETPNRTRVVHWIMLKLFTFVVRWIRTPLSWLVNVVV